MDGIIIVNKEEEYTSRDVVNIVSKHFKTKKVGHTGTLDPLATGVLVLCLGKATKLVELITAYDKEYIATVKLGILTDTLDITGNILKEEKALISKEDIIKCLKKMEGSYNQEVPIYSAIKIKGKKLYEYARNNESVSLPKRKVNIKKIELLSVEYTKENTIFKIKCLVSKGTYIRSLIRDIALNLNTIGCMVSLVRTKQGNISIDDSYTLKQIQNNEYKLYNLDTILSDLYTIKVDDYLEEKIKNGSILQNRYNKDVILFKNKNGNLLAIYKIYEKDNNKIKPWKMLI